jgi:hypothetical protein
MPQFTAEASLYRAGRHYRTCRSLGDIRSPSPTTRVVHPAREMEEEVIHVHSCAPGWIDIGGSCWPAPLTEPSSGGTGGGSGLPSGGGGSGGGGGGMGPGVPATETEERPICRPPLQQNPDYNPTICQECVGVCDSTYPLTPCEGSKVWCQAINAEPLRKRRECYEGTCGWRCNPCA